MPSGSASHSVRIGPGSDVELARGVDAYTVDIAKLTVDEATNTATGQTNANFYDILGR